MPTTNKSATVNASPSCRGDYLIPDVLATVFDFLDLNDLLRCMKACRRWRAASRDHPTFSRLVNLRSLAPNHYSRFLAQILHKERSGSALWLKLTLLDDSVIPRKLREMLKRVWPRMVRFSIETLDAESAVTILSNPSPRLEEVDFVARNSRGADPELTASFLGGHAPVLQYLKTMLVALPSSPRLAVLQNVKTLLACGYYIESFKSIPLQFPRLQCLDIVDPGIGSPLDKADVDALQALGAIPHIHLRFRLYPEWAPYLVDALPLSAIRRLSILIPQGPHEGGSNIDPEMLHAMILSMPGDLSVVMHTALSTTNPEYDFVVTSKDENGREFRRDFGMGIFLARFPITQSICKRIVRLAVHAPDWDCTCLWLYGLQRLEVLKLVFADEVLLRDWLRPERTFRRRPVPMSFMHTTLIDVNVGRKLDVDYGLLHAFLRKGTMQPCIPLQEQHVIFNGVNITGEAEILLPNSNTTITATVDVAGTTLVFPPDW